MERGSKESSLSKERRYASVAQLVEQGTENPRVVGSIPTGGTNLKGSGNHSVTSYADLAHLVERRLAKAKVAGSSPVIRSRKNGYEENTYPFNFANRSIDRYSVYIAEALLLKQSRGGE